jgi:hypothetical protein
MKEVFQIFKMHGLICASRNVSGFNSNVINSSLLKSKIVCNLIFHVLKRLSKKNYREYKDKR